MQVFLILKKFWDVPPRWVGIAAPFAEVTRPSLHPAVAGSATILLVSLNDKSTMNI